MKNGVFGVPLQRLTTDKTGLAGFTGLTLGDSRIVETKAPYGYKLWTNPVDFSIDEDGNVLVGKDKVKLPEVEQVYMAGILNETAVQKFTLKKISEENGKALAGATFQISGGEETLRITTDQNGTASLNLPYGSYVLEELIAPDGYVLDNTKHMIDVTEQEISVDGAALKDNTFTLKNASVSFPLALHKQDSATGAALSGAEFRISGNGVSIDLKTNSSGDTDTVYLKPGSYAITETKAPTGYTKPLTGWKLTVDENGRAQVDGDNATVSVGAGSVIITLENTKSTTHGNTPGSTPGNTPGTTPGSGIAKTGQIWNNTLLLNGLLLMLFSFTGLLVLLLDESKRRRIIKGL